MSDIDPAIQAAKLQKEWESRMRKLFVEMRTLFQQGTVLTILAHNPKIPDSEFCWTEEHPDTATQNLRAVIDVLETRGGKHAIEEPPMIIDPSLNGLNVKVENKH